MFLSNNKLDISKLPKEVLLKLIEDPAFFVDVVFGEYLWSKQREIAYALLTKRKVAVYSCYGVGKTHIASRFAIYFHQTRENSIVGITAPNFQQVKNNIFREIHSAYRKSKVRLLGEPTTVEWNITRGKWYMFGFSSDEPDKVQGKHSNYVLAIVEEASGVNDNIISAMESWGTGGEFYELLIGNPLRPSGRFYETLFDPTFYKIQISAFDTPNFTGEKVPEEVKKFLITPEFVEDVELRYGKDSDFYKVAVLGQFPEEDESGLFSLPSIEQCMKLEQVENNPDEYCITVDIARYGDDATQIVIWKGFEVEEVIQLRKNNTLDVANVVKAQWEKYNPSWITIDTSGMGVGVYDILVSMGIENLYGVAFHEPAYEEEKYVNTRTEMYFNLAHAIREKRVKLPKIDELKNELLAQKYTFSNDGRFKLIDKEIIKKRLGRSPDLADALAMRFYVRRPKVAIV